MPPSSFSIKRPRHGTLPFGSRGGVCITIRAAVSTGAHDTLLQGACAAPFCKKRRCCASLRGVLRSVKLMRVIFPTRGGINRLSRLARLPASAPQDHMIGGSSLFSALCPGFDKSASWRSLAQKGKSTQISLRAFSIILYRIICIAFKFSNVHLCTVLSASAKVVYRIIMQLVHRRPAHICFTVQRILYLWP